MKIPYGISNFEKLATEDYYFVDRTKYIEKLENLGETCIVFLRPRRFGKSLFISMLEHYYDLKRKNDFERLFSKYYIGSHKTPRVNSYMILKFDFSGIDTQSLATTFRGFREKIIMSIKSVFCIIKKDKVAKEIPHFCNKNSSLLQKAIEST